MTTTTTTRKTAPKAATSKDLIQSVGLFFAAEKAAKAAESAANRSRKTVRSVTLAGAAAVIVSDAASAADATRAASDAAFGVLLDRLAAVRTFKGTNVSDADAAAYGFDSGNGDVDGPEIARTLVSDGSGAIVKRMRTVHGF